MFVLPAKFLADDVKVGIFREIRFVSVLKVGRLQQKTFPRGCGKGFFRKIPPGSTAWAWIAAIRRLSQQEAVFVHFRFYLPGE